MLSTQTMTSTSIFKSPFHEPPNDPEAFGSYTSCQGPSTKPQTSPVAKIRRHIVSAFAPKHPIHSTDFLKPEPNIVSLPFVPEFLPTPPRACSPTPPGHQSPRPPATSNSLEPFGALRTDLILDIVADDIPKQPKPSRKLRHLSSRATIADTGCAASTTPILEDSMSIPTLTSIQSRPTTAAGDGRHLPNGVGQRGTKGCHCPCSCSKCRYANTKLCNCACWCKNCHCKSRRPPNRFLRILEDHGFGRRRTSSSDAQSGEEKCGNEQIHG